MQVTLNSSRQPQTSPRHDDRLVFTSAFGFALIGTLTLLLLTQAVPTFVHSNATGSMSLLSLNRIAAQPINAPTTTPSRTTAGYVVTSNTSYFTHISGSWTVPPVWNVTPSNVSNMTGLFLGVGLGGYNASSSSFNSTFNWSVVPSIQFVGLRLQPGCVNATSCAGYAYGDIELDGTNLDGLQVNSIALGDNVTGSVTYSPLTGNLTGVLTDTTRNVTTQQSISARGWSHSSFSSAEWFATEYPRTQHGRDLPIISSTFTHCRATVAGQSHAIGAFGSIVKLRLVDYFPTGHTDMTVTGLTSRGESFSLVWKSR